MSIFRNLRSADGFLPAGWGGFLRLAIVTVGGILVLQSTDSVDASKVAYLLLAGIAVAGTLLRLPRLRHTDSFSSLRELLGASVVLLFVIALSLPVALGHGVPPLEWLRDASAYGLFSLAALVALDAHAAPRAWLLALGVTVGALSAASYVIAWLDIRSIADAPIERLVLPSGALASMLLVVTSALAFGGTRRRYWWAIAAGATLGLFLILGTRGRVPFVLLPIMMAALAGGRVPARMGSLAAQLAVAVAVVLAVPVIQTLADSTTSSGQPSSAGQPPATGQPQQPTDVIARRIGSINDLVQNPAGDPSMRERLSQTIGAWRLFVENPLVGAGPGALITWNDYAGQEQRTWTVDSPLGILPKFGLVGLAAGLAWIVSAGMFAARVLPRLRGSSEWLMLVGQIVVLSYATLFAPPMQDKGTAFAIMLVLALVLHRAYRAPHRSRRIAS